MENQKFQVFEKFSTPSKTCSEARLLAGISGSTMQQLILPIRKLIESGEKEQADIKKKLLPAITISGTFSGGRRAENLLKYSHIICLDLDKIEEEKLFALKELAMAEAYSRMVFISPSGLGLKILVEVSSGLNYHKDAYRQVMKYYSKKLQVPFDESTCDVTRLTFLSYDPDVYYAPNSIAFPVSTPITKNKNSENNIAINSPNENLHAAIYAKAYKLTCNRFSHVEGQRNNFIFQLANHCNRFGLPQLALECFIEWSDLPEKADVLNSVYKNVEQFGTWNFASGAEDMDIVTGNLEEQSVSSDSPVLPDEVFELVPDFIKDITSYFAAGTERDLVLLSCLGIISSAFPNVQGIYARSTKALNLFQLFVAPPSSGKGQMKWAELLGRGIHKYLKDKYKSEYETCMANGNDLDAEALVEKSFFIATDSSNIALANQMRDNVNIGVMYDSEGSTLATMFKNDWSNSLNILLKSFENESVAINRKMRLESFNIEKTFLSLVLSTTPSQLVKIIGDIDSGLYSRFLIYYFRSPVVWKDFFSSESDCLEPIFEQASQRLLDMYIANEKNPITTIGLTEKQREETFNFFEQRQNEFHSIYDYQLLANVRRTCVMYYKIAMILTTLRAYESGDVLPERLIVDDRDHKTAMLIVETLLQHVKIVYDNTQPEQSAIPTGKKKALFNGLPAEAFAKNEYLSISNELGIKKPTAEKWLKDLQHTGKVIRLDHGQYQKAA